MWLHERLLTQPFLAILLFHRVNDSIPEDGLTVSTWRFRQICQLLRERFRVISLAEVFRIVREKAAMPRRTVAITFDDVSRVKTTEPRESWMPRRTVAITFDDCYADNWEAAHILHQYQLPATFFLPTGFVGTRRRFEWDRGLPELPNLTWQQVREMAALGHDIGSHTVNHVNMGEVNLAVAWYELTASRGMIEDQVGRACRFFAYPFGGPQHFRSEYLPLLEQAGYEGGLSAFGGFVRPGCDDRLLPREAVPYFKSLSHLELHLSGCLNWWYAWRGRERSQTEVPQGFEDQPSEMSSLSRRGFVPHIG